MTIATMIKKLSMTATGATCLALGMLSMGVIEYNPAQAATVINTAPNWDGSSNIAPWGTPDTSTYGQTFTVNGPDNVLESFSFQIWKTTSPIPFAAYVAEWSGGRQGQVAGPLLYNSGLQSFSNTGSGFQQVSFNTGGIHLNTGSKYVAFLSTSGFQSGQPESVTSFGVDYQEFFGESDVYAGGEFVFYNAGDDLNRVLNSNWGTYFPADAAFQANLTGATPVPTPALLPGLIGLGLGVLRKRKTQAD